MAFLNWIGNDWDQDIHDITSNEQRWIKTHYATCSLEVTSGCDAMSMQKLQKTIEHHVIHFGYLKMDLMRHIAESFRQMGSGENYTTDISEQQHLANVKEAYQSSNNVNYIRQILKQND